MDQASRIIAKWSSSADSITADLISAERIVCGAWKKAVGKRLADRTQAVKLVRDKLIVEVEDELWRKNLWGLRYHILQNLRKAIGPDLVKDLEFRVMPPRREAGRATAPALADPAIADDSLAIQDPGMRRIYRNARRRETA
jgi:hypothetical protein